jgi:hypothetical protein
MARLVIALALCTAAACGTDADDRPLTARFMTEEILAPTCGTAECHSTYAQAGPIVTDTTTGAQSIKPYVFDTLVGTRRALAGGGNTNGLVVLDSTSFDPDIPAGATFIAVLLKNDPLTGIDRMPLDAPLPYEDIKILEDWVRGVPSFLDPSITCTTDADCTTAGGKCHIANGSTTGQCAIYEAPLRGAQCNPKNYSGMACINKKLYQCGSDWNVVAGTDMLCPSECSQGKCL